MNRDEFDKLLQQRLQQAREELEPPKRAKPAFTVGRRKGDGWTSEKEPWES